MSKKGTNPSNAEYEVGYAKPPVSGRFQKGDRGNRKGRRKGQTVAPTMRDILNELHVVIERRKKRRMTAREFIDRGQVAKAMAGDFRSATYVRSLADSELASAQNTGWDLTKLSDEELEILRKLALKATGVEP